MTRTEPVKMVSIIIPAFNYAHFLPETLDSVRNQSLGSWECIIVDDGSTDATEEIAAQYLAADHRFKYIYQENKGLAAARNTGITRAQGTYIQLLDADDLLEANKLLVQSDFLNEHPEVDIVYGDARFFPTEKPTERHFSIWGEDQPWMPNISGSGTALVKALLKSNIMVVSSPLLCKDIFQSCGLFDESLTNHEDWDLWLRCALAGKHFHFLNSPETKTLIRFHQCSMSQDRTKMYEVNLHIRRALFEELNSKDLIKINRTYYRGIGLQLAYENIDRKNRWLGLTQLVRYGLNVEYGKTFLAGCYRLLFGSRP